MIQSTNSFWEETSFLSRQHIIIVGGGIAGLWCAYELISHQPKAKITVLEKAVTPTGASTRNAGFACFGSPTEMICDADTMGENEMWKVVEMRYKGIEKIRKILGDSAIDYDDCGGYECLTISNAHLVNERLNWLNAGMRNITNNPATFTQSNKKQTEFGLRGFSSIVENKLEGGLHSGKLVQALMRKVQSMGVTVLSGAEVTSYEHCTNYIEVTTRPNTLFTTNKLLFCTNALALPLSKLPEVTPARGQILLTAPIPGLQLNGTFHFDEGFYYFRNIDNRVLLGGARNKALTEEETVAIQTTQVVQAELEHFLQSHILHKIPYTITNRWSGIMSFTKNKLPLVKEIEPHVWSMAACNGMGVALTPMVAEWVNEFMS